MKISRLNITILKQKVKEIMGGRFLGYKGRSIFYDGIAVSEERGRLEEKLATAKRLQNAGTNYTQIHQFTDLTT